MNAPSEQPLSDFALAARAVIEALDRGEVMTYGEVAAEAGFPGAARAVGGLLRKSEGLPWWRVVSSSGRLVPGLEVEHERLLLSEGVTVTNGRIDG